VGRSTCPATASLTRPFATEACRDHSVHSKGAETSSASALSMSEQASESRSFSDGLAAGRCRQQVVRTPSPRSLHGTVPGGGSPTPRRTPRCEIRRKHMIAGWARAPTPRNRRIQAAASRTIVVAAGARRGLPQHHRCRRGGLPAETLTLVNVSVGSTSTRPYSLGARGPEASTDL
jgi:hypothetical protein